MKTLFNILLIVLIIYIVKNTDTKKVIDEVMVHTNPIESVNEVSNPQIKKRIDRTYKVVVLGDINYNDYSDTMNDAMITLENVGVNIDLEYSGRIQVDGEFFIPSTDGSVTEIMDNQKFFSVYSKPEYVIYLTTNEMWDSNIRGYIRGYSTGINVIVRVGNGWTKETLIHELGHNLNLGHCNDLSCIMAINNDEYDSGTFCNNCKSKLGTYE